MQVAFVFKCTNNRTIELKKQSVFLSKLTNICMGDRENNIGALLLDRQ